MAAHELQAHGKSIGEDYRHSSCVQKGGKMQISGKDGEDSGLWEEGEVASDFFDIFLGGGSYCCLKMA